MRNLVSELDDRDMEALETDRRCPPCFSAVLSKACKQRGVEV